MNDYPPQGTPDIIKIDGAKIKSIREAKGLTQLYIATAVEVTTDTVSRWENKRYPTIKKENALRLADALEIDLAELLDRSDDATEQQTAEAPGEPNQLTAVTDYAIHPENPGPTGTKSRRPVLLFSGVALLGLLAIAVLLLRSADHTAPESPITVSRVAPAHFVAGRPFPVLLTIDTHSMAPVSVIIRETIPPDMKLGGADPPVSGQDRKDHSIKWLKKVTGTTTFVYTLVSDPSYTGSISFDGQLKVTGPTANESRIRGDERSIAGLHHWADSNRDNRISDEEILAVYDSVGSEKNINIDMDLIEDIWLGDGYRWDPGRQRFVVLD